MDDSGNLLDKMKEGESPDQEENLEVASLAVNPPTVSGRLTPMRANTMKECEQLIEELRKENFSLKLRIYFLEDRCRQKFGGNIFNMNIELNVQVESLKNDVLEKQELLKKAYLTLESLTKTYQDDLKKALEKKETEWSKDKENILRQLQDTEKNLAVTKEKLEDADTVVGRLQAELHDQAEQLKQEVIERQKNFNEGAHKDSELEDLRKMIDQLGSELESKHRLEENYVEKIRKLEKSLGRKEKDIEDIMDDQQENINKMKSEIEQLNTSVTEKDDTLLALEENIKKVQSELETEKSNGLKKNKLIKGLTQNLHDKMNEVQELQKQILKDKDDLNKTRQELYEVSLQKHKNLVDSIEKKEQELNSFRDMLNKTRDALKQSEDAVQQLQDQLQREKKQAKENLALQTNQYQLMIQDLQQQLHGKDLLIQQLTDNLKEKDKQLHEYLQMMRNNKEKDKDELIESLEEKLKTKEECLKKTLCDQIHVQEDLNVECHQLRLALRERDSNMEKANEMLLSAQETINMVEKQSKMKEMNVNKLSTALKAAQNLHKEQSENHSRIMAEKDDLIQHLQNVITVKNKALEETLRLHMSDSENKVLELEKRLLAKDQQLQDLMEEKKKSALGNERSSHELLDKLKMKDSDIKNLIEKQNLEMADKIRDLQKFRLDISRKDYEIQTLETNSAIIEKMQDAELKKLRSALEDKDKTIKTLVDSCQQKESLIRQLQENNSQEAAKQHSMTIELQCVQDELRKLQENDGDTFNSETHVSIKFKNLEEQLKKAKEELFNAWKFEHEARQDAEKMKARMMELERENQALLELRKEYVHMRDRASEASSPCRSSVRESDQKMWELMQQQLEEMKALRDALSTEQNIWSSLCKTVYRERDHPVKSLEAELLALQNLRQQLEQGIDQNNKLRSNMFKQLKAELDYLNRSNQSLDQPNIGNSILPQSGPGISPTETMGSASNEIANIHSKNFKARSHSDPNFNSKVNMDSCSQHFSEIVEYQTACSTPTTSRSLRLFLQDEQSCLQENSTSSSLPKRGNSAPEIVSPLSISKDPPFQIYSELQQLLEAKTKENLLLRSKLGLLDHVGEIDPKFVPDVNQLKKEVGDLKTELNKASNTISILKQQISINMQDELSETQCKPELIVHMAKEIKKMREERKACLCGIYAGSGEQVQNVPDKENLGHQYHRRSKSRKEQSLLKNQTVQNADDTTDSHQHIKYLNDKIMGLDMLVSQQSREIDWYKNVFENSGFPFKRSPSSKNFTSLIYGGQKFMFDSEPEPDFQCQKVPCAENAHRLKSQVAELKDQLQRDLEIINSLQSELAMHKSELQQQQQQRLSSNINKDHNSGTKADLSTGLSPMLASHLSSSKVTHKTKSPNNLSNTLSSLSSKLYFKMNPLENSGLNGNISEVVMLLKHLTTSFNVCKKLSTYVIEIENSLDNCVKDIRQRLLLKKKINNLHAVIQHLQSLLQGPYGNEKGINTNNNNSLRDPTPSNEWLDQLFTELQPNGDITQHSTLNMDQKTLHSLSEDALQSMQKMTAAATEASLDCPNSSHLDKCASKLVISGSVCTTPTNRDRRKQSGSQSNFSPSYTPKGRHNQSANIFEKSRGAESCSEASIPNSFSLPEVIELDITGRLSLSELYLNQQQLKDSRDIPLPPAANIAKDNCINNDQHRRDNYMSRSVDQQLGRSMLDPTGQNISFSKQQQSWFAPTDPADHSKSLPSSPSNTISSKDAIRSHLLVSQDLSNTLRQEISVYDFLETSTANSLNLSANQSLNTSQLESFKKYLLELRAQRIKLEGTVDRNERLQEKLIEILNHDKIKGSPSSVAKDIARLEEQKHQLTYLQKLLGDQQNQLDERLTQMEHMKKNIQDRDAQILEKDKLLGEKETQIGQLNNQVEIAQSRIKTLEQDIFDVREQLSENKDLNSTLKLELSMYEQLDMKTKAQPKSKKFDIREFLVELKNLRKSMERCISTNNILRRKLEELLLPHTSFLGDNSSSNNNNNNSNSNNNNNVANRSQNSVSNQNLTNGNNAVNETNKLRSNMLSHTETSALTKELERLEAEDDQQVDSAHGSGDSELASSYGNNTSELLKQTIDIIENSSCSLNQQSTSLSRNLFGSPKVREDGAGNDVMADLHPLQSDSNDGVATGSNSNSKGQLSSVESIKVSIKSSCTNSENPNDNPDVAWASSVDFINGGLHSDKVDFNSASTWPGSSPLGKDHITYWSFDPPGNPVNSPVRISSDLRSLFAIGKLDDYELLRKENNEMSYVVRNLQARLRDRIKVHKSLTPNDLYKNKEYSTLRDLSLLVENLNVCLGEESRLISNFWLSQLPLRNRKGLFHDPLKLRKNGEIIAELDEIQRNCDIANEKVKIVEDQLNTTNLIKENNDDEAVVQQIKQTEKALQLSYHPFDSSESNGFNQENPVEPVKNESLMERISIPMMTSAQTRLSTVKDEV